MTNAIEVRGLCKEYGDFRLDRVDLTVPCGAIVGLIGENGAGKSTTLRAILNLIRPDGGTVKVSRSLKELSLRVVRGREQLAVRLGRDPTIEELAEELGLTREEVVEALNVSAPPLSLTVSSEEGETQIDLPVQSPEENLSERMALRQILGELEPRDRQLIILRYFMDKTQTQTAEQLGMTQVQVSRREKKLLLAMRQKLL